MLNSEKKSKIERKINILQRNRKQSYLDERKQREKTAISKIKTDSRYFSRYANSFRRTLDQPSIIIDDFDNVISEPSAISNILQDYFKSVFSTPQENFDISDLRSPNITKPLSDPIFTAEDFINAIDEIKSYSACPKFDIPAKILKRCKKSLARPLQLFWEKSFNLGEIPDAYKMQQIIPLHKKGPKTSANNFRPISLTSHIIKIFERVLRKKLVHFLEENKIINQNQHGFRKNCSCLTQLLSHTNYIFQLLSQDVEVDTIYVDFSKAFDKVDHEILLKKLELYGVNGRYHKWIRSFLTGRKQTVLLNNCFSYDTPVISGVPQGSVLGPLLFVIYVNDMVNTIISSRLQTFADDTKLAKPIYSATDRNVLQEDLNMIKAWSRNNNMELNENKFELICHRRKATASSGLLSELPFMNEYFTYAATNNITIYPSPSVRDLGVIVDPQLSWDSHISKITVNARRMLGWIFNVFLTRDKETMLLLYKSLVRSRLEFCCELWDPHTINNINKLEQIQRSFTSKFNDAKEMNYWERLIFFNMFSLQRRRERQTIIHTWKIRNQIVRNDADLEFRFCDRSSKVKAVLKPLPKIKGRMLSLYENCYVIRAARLWNQLPKDIAEEKSLGLFKGKLNKWLKAFPDKPPIHGYYHVNNNSILEYHLLNGRYV